MHFAAPSPRSPRESLRLVPAVFYGLVIGAFLVAVTCCSGLVA